MNNFSKEWCLKAALRDRGESISAGALKPYFAPLEQDTGLKNLEPIECEICKLLGKLKDKSVDANKV